MRRGMWGATESVLNQKKQKNGLVAGNFESINTRWQQFQIHSDGCRNKSSDPFDNPARNEPEELGGINRSH